MDNKIDATVEIKSNTPIDLSNQNEHQLDKLPDLPPEKPVWQHPIFIITMSFVISGLIALCLSAYYHIDSTVVNQFLTGSLTTHTSAVGGFATNQYSKNSIYQKAASQPLIQNQQQQ